MEKLILLLLKRTNLTLNSTQSTQNETVHHIPPSSLVDLRLETSLSSSQYMCQHLSFCAAQRMENHENHFIIG